MFSGYGMYSDPRTGEMKKAVMYAVGQLTACGQPAARAAAKALAAAAAGKKEPDTAAVAAAKEALDRAAESEFAVPEQMKNAQDVLARALLTASIRG